MIVIILVFLVFFFFSFHVLLAPVIQVSSEPTNRVQ